MTGEITDGDIKYAHSMVKFLSEVPYQEANLTDIRVEVHGSQNIEKRIYNGNQENQPIPSSTGQ
jgi:hypothetical protein